MRSGITIVGLGPGSSQYWTQAATTLLTQANEVYVRTARHPSVGDIPSKTHDFDDLFLPSSNFDQVADQLMRLAQRDTGVIYAVPGHPGIGESTGPRLLAVAKDHHIPVTIIPGLSYLEPTLATLNLDMSPGLQIVDAFEIARFHHPPLEPDRPAIITNLYHQDIAARMKHTLLNAYEESFMVTLVQAPGSEVERSWSCPLASLDRQPNLDEPTMLYLPADNSGSSFSSFQETIAHLRAPEGCPWDREQTHRSLRPFLLEETYEVLEALDANDPVALAEELGDLLLQIVLHTQIATEYGEFKMAEVISHINQKLWRRHPHVFGDVVVNGVEEVKTNWEAIKKAEKERNKRSSATGPRDQPTSALDGVPKTLPALAQALAVSQKAVGVGFEWPNVEGILDQIIEEAREITEATNPAHRETEIGDLLFSVVNLARWHNIDPESALRATNDRFTRRFKRLETLAIAQGQELSNLSLAEMETLWDRAKSFED
jgi:tetrapyrrole methylase family protein/MazG family protein